MISKTVFKEIILEYQHNIPRLSLIKRDITVDMACSYVYVGLRRAGKSYMMYADIQERIKEGKAKIEDILYINFEDERLLEITVSDLSVILESYRELFGHDNPLIYLDEIQNIDGWEKFVRRLRDAGHHVCVTGSNAKMLSREIATTLGGRCIIKYIPTFSFREFLRFEGIEPTAHYKFDNEERYLLKNKLAEYFRFGGFAETFRLVEKRQWINSLYQKILFGDIVARNGYRNDRAISLLARKLAESVKQPVTQTRLLNILKATGASISRNTIAEYLDSLNESYLTFDVTNYRHSLAERANESKHYFSDNGLLNNFLIDPSTSLLENIVAVTLLHRYYYDLGEEIFFYRNGVELDFYIPEEKMAVQVAYSVDDFETAEREYKAIAKISGAVDMEKAYIVTYDDRENEVEYEGMKIKVIPLLHFLLETL